MRMGVRSSSARRTLATPSPSTPGIITSRTIRSTGSACTAARAWTPSATVRTRYPSSSRARSRESRIARSSSATSTVARGSMVAMLPYPGESPVRARRSPGTSGFGGEFPGAPQSGGPALAGHDQRHLAGGLVQHLVAEHDGAATVHGGGVLVGVQDQFGVVVVLLCGRVDLVGGFHLQRMQHPLAVEAERRGPSGGAPEGVHVTDLQVGSVDGLQTVRTGGREDAHEHVVVGITGVV